MSRQSLAATLPHDEREQVSTDCSWASIIEGIRLQAEREGAQLSADLTAWAELLEALQSLRDPGVTRSPR